jgi:hypothetical protein
MTDMPWKRRAGQSLIEGMVAMTIIITSVSSALVVVQSSIRSSTIGGSQIIAANLAREGMEVVRALRDSNWLGSANFQTGLVSGAIKTARPFLDPVSGAWTLTFSNFLITDAAALLYLTPQAVYVQTDAPAGLTATPYRRQIVINHICRNNVGGAENVVSGASLCTGTQTLVGLAVASSVRYVASGGGARTVTVEERLYDWR